MKEVYPGIFQITVKESFVRLRPEVNVFVIAGPDGLVFDAGFGTRGVGRFVVSEIKKIKEICEARGEEFHLSRVMASHSHGDHFPGMHYLRKKLGLKIVVTEKIARNITGSRKYHRVYDRHQTDEWYTGFGPIRALADRCGVMVVRFFFRLLFGVKFITDPDQVISDNETVSINGKPWQVLPAPGHSFDHIHLYNKEEGLMFVGDNILRGINPWLGPPESDLKAYIETLEGVMNTVGLKVLFCGHGSPVTTPGERVSRLIRYRLDRVEDVFDIVSGSGSEGVSLNEVINTVYLNESGFKKNLGRGWITITLKYLEREGRVSWKNGKRGIRLYEKKS